MKLLRIKFPRVASPSGSPSIVSVAASAVAQEERRFVPPMAPEFFLRVLTLVVLFTLLPLSVTHASTSSEVSVLAGWPTPPSAADNAFAAEFSALGFTSLQQGDLLQFRIPETGNTLLRAETVRLQVLHSDSYLNGDRVIHGRGIESDVSLVLTLNERTAFADLDIDGQRWLFSAQRQQDVLRGWFYQITGPVLTDPVIDYVIPAASDAVLARNHKPLQLADYANNAIPTRATHAASGGGLVIEQHFSEFALKVGQATELEVSLQFRNTGPQNLANLTADIYFILEDAVLISAPACQSRLSTTVPRQPILRCELAGGLPAGASRSLSYLVRVEPKPSPMRLWSTVFVDQLRHDAFVNVVNDVEGSALEGGLSSFNLAEQRDVSLDRLGNTVIDIMTLYTPDAEAIYGVNTATRINQLISVANQIYRDSGVKITLRPVHHGPVAYQNSEASFHSMLEQLTYNTNSAFAHIPSLRERYGADLVVLFRALPEASDMCGLANLGGHRTAGDMTAFNERDFAFSLVAINCPISSVLAHELGHNMGLTHSHREDGQGGTLPYATGYGVDHGFTTVMASPVQFNNATRSALFSSPALLCMGLPCGVDHRDRSHGADAVRTLNLVRFQIANYMPTRVPFMPSRPVADLQGRPSAARIALAVSTDGGLTYVTSASTSQKLDIKADFYVDPQHVGKPGFFHVLADLTSSGLGFVQLNDRGELFEWNGKVEDLVPYNDVAPLRAVEYINILSGFEPLPEMAGAPFMLFLGYQLPATGELIYTIEPLTIDIQNQP